MKLIALLAAFALSACIVNPMGGIQLQIGPWTIGENKSKVLTTPAQPTNILAESR